MAGAGWALREGRGAAGFEPCEEKGFRGHLLGEVKRFRGLSEVKGLGDVGP